MSSNMKKCVCQDFENPNSKICYVMGATGPKGEKGDVGPTGPKGENGPTTISVGSTTTVNPDEDASVSNVGTTKDVILNFKIPRGINGEKGEKGDIGPRGLPGEIGISEGITIDGAETISSDEEASVLDDFEDRIHHLTFYIPKGEKGDRGPQGSPGVIPTIVYAQRYRDTALELKLERIVDTIVPLDETNPAFNAKYDTSNAIDIKETSFYKIDYFLSVTTKEDAMLTLTVKANDLLLPASKITINSKANTFVTISNSIITSLSNNDVLTLNIRSEEESTLVFNDSTGASLSILKIH